MPKAERILQIPQDYEKLVASITKDKDKLVSDIREYSHIQAPLWRLVPELALEADGRSGFGNGDVYRHRVWPVLYMTGRVAPEAFVDLDNGDIVGFRRQVRRAREDNSYGNKISRQLWIASDEEVLRLAANLEILDASKVVTRLQREAQSYPEYVQEPFDPTALPSVMEREEWRARVREELGLNKPLGLSTN